MSDIFLSYASSDVQRAEQLAHALERKGWTVWWDRQIPPGKIFDEVIQQAMESASCVIVIWSEHSVRSNWVKEEAAEGARRKILVPCLVDEVPLPMGFGRIEAARLIGWRSDESDPEFIQLCAAIDSHIKESSQPGDQVAVLNPQEEFERTPQSIANEERLPDRKQRWRWLGLSALALLLVAGVIGYLATNSIQSDKKAIEPPQIQEQPDNPPSPARAERDWLIIAGSFGRTDTSAAEKRRLALAGTGLEVTMIDTTDYPLLTPNLWAVVVGPFESKETASAALARVKMTVPDAYVKKGR